MTFVRYYKPACRVVAAGIEVINLDGSGLRIAFEVTRTLESRPDVARVRVWGLSLERRIAIREVHRLTGALPLEIHAGWDLIALPLFIGQGTRVSIDLGTDYSRPTLEVEAGDGVEGYSGATLEFATLGITVLELVQNYAAPALVEPVPGLPAQTFPSNTVRLSPDAIATLSAASGASVGTFANGYVFSGSARDLMDEICRTIGARWWIANGIMEVVPARAPSSGQALVLRPSSGLLAHAKGDDLDGIRCRALLDPAALPGRLFIPQTDLGVPIGEPAYRVEAVTFTGDTDAGPWSMDLVGRGGLTLG